MQLQQSDPILNMGLKVMRPAFNLEPKHRVIMLTREEWTRGPVTHPVVKGLVWFTDGSRMKEGTRAVIYGQSVGRRLKGVLQFFRLKYMLSWPVLMKFNCIADQRST